MSLWHAAVIRLLEESKLFENIQRSGGKIRAVIRDNLFLDIHFDPVSRSYSYALIDLTSPFPGDKRIFGWDDYPHPGVPELQTLSSAPHHVQKRMDNGTWLFSISNFRGEIEEEIPEVLNTVREFLASNPPPERK